MIYFVLGFVALLIAIGFQLSRPKYRMCCICYERRGETDRYIDYDYAGSSTYYFHEGCIYAVLEDPECYDNAAIDRALWLADKLKDQRHTRKREQRRRESRILDAKAEWAKQEQPLN